MRSLAHRNGRETGLFDEINLEAFRIADMQCTRFDLGGFIS